LRSNVDLLLVGKVLATAHEDGSIILWSIETGEPFHAAKNPKIAQGPFIMDIPITYMDWIKEIEQPNENSLEQVRSRYPTLL